MVKTLTNIRIPQAEGGARSLELKIAMLRQALSVTGLAEELGYSPAYVSMLIAGKRKSDRFEAWVEENLDVRGAA